jgi:hypothetical protein
MVFYSGQNLNFRYLYLRFMRLLSCEFFAPIAGKISMNEGLGSVHILLFWNFSQFRV